MHFRLVALMALIAIAPATAQTPRPATTAQGIPEIKYEKFVLPNGLTLLVHEDHKAPIVAVNVWYHVGLEEREARQDRLRAPLRASDVQRQRALQRRLLQGRSSSVGATDLNGTTNTDRTNYFQNVPDLGARLVLCASSRTAWGISSARSTRRGSTSSAASCRTRSGRARTSRTARHLQRSPRTPIRAAIRIRGR